MAENSQEAKFKWKSWLGLSVVLFLLYGAFNVFAAIMVPYSLTTMGAGSMGGLIVNLDADAKILGKSLTDLMKTDPALNDYLVAFMLTMCNQMMQFAILQLAVVWFALRRAKKWALIALTLADLAFLPYLLKIAGIFGSYGVTQSEIWSSFGYFWPMVLVGIAVAFLAGWKAVNQSR